MSESGIGRLLVASLHQGIADLLPDRLEFYESWFNPAGLRDGRIGLAPFAAVLSFLRREETPYQLVARRAGEYTAEWTLADLPTRTRLLLRVMPAALRLRIALGIARRMIRQTYGGTRAVLHPRPGGRVMEIRGSLFCQLRTRADQPMCVFYAAAVRRLLELTAVGAEVRTEACRATGDARCELVVLVRPPVERN